MMYKCCVSCGGEVAYDWDKGIWVCSNCGAIQGHGPISEIREAGSEMS